MKIRIEVTQEDINTGDHLGYHCPIAKALMRAGLLAPCVGYTSFSYTEKAQLINRDWNDQQITDFIINYDLKKFVTPIQFWLEI